MRSVSLLIVLLSGALSAGASPGTAVALFTIEISQARLAIHGSISSVGHAQIIRRTVALRFPNIETDIDLEVGTSLPPKWSLITDQTLRALAHTQSATAEITSDRIILRGFTTDPESWFVVLDQLEKLLAPDFTLESTVDPFSNGLSFDSVCRQLFAAAIHGRDIEFARNVMTLSSSAHALLDELAELATDCPSASIKIIGNGDGGPDNQLDGKRRALAVAAYLKGLGLDPARLKTVGAKTSTNRRIVFSFSF